MKTEPIQLSIDFNRPIPTASDINVEKLSGQNRRLLEYLMTGQPIHCMHVMKQRLGIGYLNSRISDLRRFLRYSPAAIADRLINVEGTFVKEYTLKVL